jgi:hypothetical protein
LSVAASCITFSSDPLYSTHDRETLTPRLCDRRYSSPPRRAGARDRSGEAGKHSFGNLALAATEAFLTLLHSRKYHLIVAEIHERGPALRFVARKATAIFGPLTREDE